MKHALKTITEISRALNRQHGKNPRLPSVIFITDQGAVPSPEAVIRSLPKGAAVLFRDYHLTGREDLGSRLRGICQELGLIFLVGRDVGLAEHLDADGVHLPEAMVSSCGEVRKKHPRWLITAAAHSAGALRQAEEMGCDAALLSPVFATKSHPQTLPQTLKAAELTLGIAGLNKICADTKLPVYALGGINEDTAPLLLESDVVGLAAIRGFKN